MGCGDGLQVWQKKVGQKNSYKEKAMLGASSRSLLGMT